jgi:hypothetical protein
MCLDNVLVHALWPRIQPDAGHTIEPATALLLLDKLLVVGRQEAGPHVALVQGVVPRSEALGLCGGHARAAGCGPVVEAVQELWREQGSRQAVVVAHQVREEEATA